jgi:predicted DNA-binding ribbon-helix-helix protein
VTAPPQDAAPPAAGPAAPAPAETPVKRSLTLSGHRTSVALEPAFWAALAAMAAAEGAPLARLAARIDAARPPGVALASALRVAALRWALEGR